ncbi:MAG: magnesium/cobalt transporter CorA [Isosphaeraceae bacterium]
MTVATAAVAGTSAAPRGAGASLYRIVYRDAAGAIHLDWPLERLGEVMADTSGFFWIDIEDRPTGPDPGVEALMRDVFRFHPLAIEDALKDCHVPRVDDWGDYLYIVFHSIDFDPETDHLRLHEVDIFLGRNYVLTYHTEPLGFLENDRRNIERDPVNRMRHGADHLLYRFLDAAVAEFIPAIEHLDEAIDNAQEEVFHSPGPETLQTIFRVKRSALKVHRAISPQRELLNRLARDSYDPIRDDHRVYFRDVYDHLVRIHDLTESLRDLVSGALDTYLSAISNRTNDIMKTLTIVTVMFLPMSFLTGFFGMNFFGETLAFPEPLPRGLMFVSTCMVMSLGFFLLGWVARKRNWI